MRENKTEIFNWLVQAATPVLKFVRSPWAQGFAIYALMIALGVCRKHSTAPISEAAGKAESQPPAERKLVRIVPQREGEVTHFLVENRERSEVTVTFNFELANLKSSKDLPLTATFPPQCTTEAFTLTPVNSEVPWQFSYTNFHNLGSVEAVHDDSFQYGLPYAAGCTFRVSQAYDGKFSHQGSNRYAVDWAMPEGTPVHAARGGLVVKVKDDSNRGGGDIKFDPFNNYVLIRHSDGTLGQYCHLKKGGVTVREGDIVNDGELIAHSGNTGFSSGPHLHFSVYKMKNGKERESIPVKFRTSAAAGITLESGEHYTAAQPAAIVAREPQNRSAAGRAAGG